MIGKGKWGHAATAVALTAVAALAAGCSASGGSGAGAIAGSLPTNYGPAEQTTLNVGVVPAMDSAGFFVALNEGLFTKEGLKINYTPATSSETAIQQQVRASSRSPRATTSPTSIRGGPDRPTTRSRSSPRARSCSRARR